jgi:sarcosine oxidase
MTPYDVIILGVGGMGSAAAWHIARRGRRVLGLERFDIPHRMGSSHGLTRIIRLAYYESPLYVPLLRRAYENWREAERLSGRRLFFITGSVDAGPRGSQVVRGSLASCIEYDLAHEYLSATELGRRFPAFALPADYEAVFQPEGGFLASEQAIVTHTELAQAHGADIRAREKVLGFEPTSDGVRVTTERGIYEAGQLVVAAGAWIRDFIPALAGCAVPERQVLGWFQPQTPALFHPGRFPVFNLAAETERYYGLPIWGVPGFKFGRYHHLHETVDPDSDFREPHPKDEETLRAGVRRFFPDANGPVMGLATCLFTNTPDEHFIIDRLPGLPIVVASPCSGHGFKFSSVVGELLADLALTGTTRFDLAPFGLARFSATPKQT